MTPYLPLEVVETRSRIAGRQFWVRDEEGAWFWCVEYIDRRLQCFCDDGEAHADAPDTEPECIHARAAIEHMAPAPARPSAPINVGSFCD